MANIIKGHARKRTTTMQEVKDEEAMKGKSTEGKGYGRDKRIGKANTSSLPVDLKFYDGFQPEKIKQKQLAYNESIFDTIPEMYFELKMTNLDTYLINEVQVVGGSNPFTPTLNTRRNRGSYH